MAINVGQVMKASSIRLILILICLTSPMICSLLVSETAREPLQVSQTTWEVLEHDYPEAVFRDVEFLNATHGWIAGRETIEFNANGIILYTENGGDSWELQFNGTSQWISTIDVIDKHTVWVNGQGSLFYTLNGGTTWYESVVVGGNAGMSTVEFINRTHGWTAHGSILYQTNNSGVSWEPVPGWSFDDSPRMMQVISPLNIWASGFYGIYHSTDGGIIWDKVSNRGGWSVSFVGETEGWTVDDSRLAYTTDGEIWEEISIPGRVPFTEFRLRSPYLSDIQFVDEDNGWIVGDEIPVMYTPDGGLNWYEQSVLEDVNARVMAVHLLNETHGWAVGSGVIMRTRSGNDLGNRLWSGMTDPLFVSIVIVSAIAVTGVPLLYRLRKKRTSTETKSESPSIEL